MHVPAGHAVQPDDQYECVPAIQIGNVTFHNWKKANRGSLNFVQALTESCDTWFYQVGIKTGAQPIIDWALQLGFGAKCGIPLRGEAEGRVPNDEYMTHSVTKSLLSSVAGVAYDGGMIRSVDDIARDYVAPIQLYSPLPTGNRADRMWASSNEKRRFGSTP